MPRLRAYPSLVLLPLLAACDVGEISNADIGTTDGKISPAEVLAAGRLPALPNDAKDVKSLYWSGFTSGEKYLRFTAPPETVTKFIKDSGLAKAECRKLYMHKEVPKWFDPSKLESPVCYQIEPNARQHNYGLIWIQDDTILIKVTWS